MSGFPLPGANWGSLRGLRKVATTGAAGVALINGTQTILSWTAPADGQMHRLLWFVQAFATAGGTGGACTLSFTDPAGNVSTALTAMPGGLSLGEHTGSIPAVLIQSGSTASIVQSAALTAGGPVTLWSEIWAQ